jgi:hypothetical protein
VKTKPRASLPPLQEAAALQRGGRLETAARADQEVLSLPMGSTLTQAQVAHIAHGVNARVGTGRGLKFSDLLPLFRIQSGTRAQRADEVVPPLDPLCTASQVAAPTQVFVVFADNLWQGRIQMTWFELG